MLKESGLFRVPVTLHKSPTLDPAKEPRIIMLPPLCLTVQITHHGANVHNFDIFKHCVVQRTEEYIRYIKKSFLLYIWIYGYKGKSYICIFFNLKLLCVVHEVFICFAYIRPNKFALFPSPLLKYFFGCAVTGLFWVHCHLALSLHLILPKPEWLDQALHCIFKSCFCHAKLTAATWVNAACECWDGRVWGKGTNNCNMHGSPHLTALCVLQREFFFHCELVWSRSRLHKTQGFWASKLSTAPNKHGSL